MRFAFRGCRFVHAGQVPASIAFMPVVAACGGGSDSSSQASLDKPTPAVKANVISAVLDEGADVTAYIGKSTSITIRFSASEGTVTALRLQPLATPGVRFPFGRRPFALLQAFELSHPGCHGVSRRRPSQPVT